MSETMLVLEVRMSLYISAAVDESAPLTREGVAELVREYLRQPELDVDAFRAALIDSVRVAEVHASNGRTLAGDGAFGKWK